MRIEDRVLWAMVTALVLGGLVGCGGTASDSGRMVKRMALTANIGGFDPAQANDVPSARVMGALVEGLMQYSYFERPYKVEPALADGFPVVSPDGLTYTFKIKKGVYFHPDPCFKKGPGRELVAQDFIHAWKRLADTKVQSSGWWILDGWVVGLNEWKDAGADYSKDVPGLMAPDPHTLVVRLTKPYPQFLYVLTMVFTAPVPPEATEAYGKELLNHAIGTGPFMLKEWVPNSKIVLVRNPRYREETYPTSGTDWARQNGLLADAGKKLPFLDGIQYEIISEDQPRWLKFLSGQLDRNDIPKDNFDSVMVAPGKLNPEIEKKGIKVQSFLSQTLWWVEMNVQDPLLSGEKGLHLRRAIAYSHDAATFLRVIRNGRGVPSRTIIPPMLPAYDETKIAHDFSFDRAKAAKELELAGYPGGQGLPRLRFDSRSHDTLGKQIAEFVVKDLAAVGIPCDIEVHTFQEYLKRARKGQNQISWGGWIGDYPDEENWLQLLYGKNAAGGPNYSQYVNPAFDALYERIRVMSDSPERRTLIQEAMNIALADCPWRMSYCPQDYVLSQRWLMNYMASDPIYNGQKYLRIDVFDQQKGF